MASSVNHRKHQPDTTATNDLQTTEPNDVSAQLTGLRNFLNDWNAGEGPRRERDERLEEMRQNVAKTSIYSMYSDYAAEEDKDLVGRWTETLNILLTFVRSYFVLLRDYLTLLMRKSYQTQAGLQSAIVTAFILVLDPSLRPDPVDTTNQLLQQLINRLDNSSTPLMDPASDWAPPPPAIRISTWWYFGLACSLLSAFGALLSKQWVLHYQSRPSWANTNTKKAQLREVRYQSLSTWWFFGIIETLTILLQLSVLFFAIGLADYIHPASTQLFFVVVVFIALGGSFYTITLIAGAIFPTCPFKSPLTSIVYRAVVTILWILSASFVVLLTLPFLALAWVVRVQSAVDEMVDVFRQFWSFYLDMHLGRTSEKELGESSIIGEESAGAAGVLCWWLYQNDRTSEDDRQPDAKVAIETILTSLHSPNLMEYSQKMEAFDYWMLGVFSGLESQNDHTAVPSSKIAVAQRSDVLQELDAMCHFMYYSPSAMRTAIGTIKDPGYDDYWRFCKAIRVAWTEPTATSLLPIHTMRWTTVAVCLRVQLCDWADQTRQRFRADNRRFRAQVLQELPIILEAPNLTQNISDIANMVSLAAISLVDDSLAGVRKRRELMDCDRPCEQLFLALHRLSFYDPSTVNAAGQQNGVRAPKKLLESLMRASKVAVTNESQSSDQPALIQCPTFKSGVLGEALLRLLQLGISYRNPNIHQTLPDLDNEAIEGSENELVHEVAALIIAIFDQLVPLPATHIAPGVGLFPLTGKIGLSLALATYADRVVGSLNQDHLRLLNYIMGLRYHSPIPASLFSRRPRSLVSLCPHDILDTSVLQTNPNILRQFIHDVQEVSDAPNEGSRNLLLSIIVKARDLLFTPDLGKKYGDLLQELASISEQMFDSGSFLGQLDQAAVSGFQRWEELTRALKDLEVEVLAVDLEDRSTLRRSNFQSSSVGLQTPLDLDAIPLLERA